MCQQSSVANFLKFSKNLILVIFLIYVRRKLWHELEWMTLWSSVHDLLGYIYIFSRPEINLNCLYITILRCTPDTLHQKNTLLRCTPDVSFTCLSDKHSYWKCVSFVHVIGECWSVSISGLVTENWRLSTNSLLIQIFLMNIGSIYYQKTWDISTLKQFKTNISIFIEKKVVVLDDYL